MAAPDPARTSQIIVMWKLMDADLQQMNHIAQSIAASSARTKKVLATADHTDDQIATAVVAQITATVEDLQKLNYSAISLGRYAVDIAQLIQGEIDSNEQQLAAIHSPNLGSMN